MIIKKYLGISLIIVAILLSVACGAQTVRGVTPIIRMNELSHDGDTIALLLSMRNLNGVELDVQQIDFSLSVESGVLFAYNGPSDTSIVANGTETWNLEVDQSDSSRKLLNQLQSGDIKSLPYSFKGTITSAKDGKMQFEHEGHLYPVPGRPGHFR
jgi:outer membrane lipoprotein-sorting protein